jgi:ribosome-binding protein aMBF1 (putative translation factor)
MKKKRKTKDALEILARDVGDDPGYWAGVEQEMLNAEIARMIHDARTAAGLTQKQLAQRTGTSQSVIARLEDADYRGHSLGMLRRIARALGHRLEVRFLEP